MKQVKKNIKLPSEKNIDPKAFNKIKLSLGIFIAAFAFILYAQSFSFNYALDDIAVLKNNNIVHKGFSGIPELFKKSYWYGFTKIDDPIYRPASLIIFAIEWQFFPENTAVFHFTSVFLYAISCLLLFFLLCKLFKNQNLIFPFVCVLLYTAHPIHTEVVNNIKSMDEILCFGFAIASMLLLIKWFSNNSITYLILAICTYFISLLSKETGIVFLILIPLTLYVFILKENRQLYKITLIIAAVTVVYLMMRFKILINTATEGHLEIMDSSLLGAGDKITYFASAMFVLFKYILLLLIPHPLSYDYSFSQIPLKSISDPIALLAIIIYLAIAVFAFLKIKSKNRYSFAILFFLVSLFPVSNLYLKLASTMAERFLYIPSLGFCMVLTLLLIKLTKTETSKQNFSTIGQMVSKNSLLFTFVFAITALYSIKVFSRNPDWKDNATLFAHDVMIADNSARSHYNYGCVLLNDDYPKENDPAKKKAILDHAINELNKAIVIHPQYPEVYSYLSGAFIKKEDYQNALANEEKYIQLHITPDPTIHKNLAFLYQRTKQLDKALAEYDSVINEEPNIMASYIGKGEIYGDKNMLNESNNEFLKASKVDPKSPTPWIDLGVNYGSVGMFKQAMEYFKKAEELDPQSKETTYMMGITYKSLGDSIKANEYLEKSSRLTAKQKN